MLKTANYNTTVVNLLLCCSKLLLYDIVLETLIPVIVFELVIIALKAGLPGRSVLSADHAGHWLVEPPHYKATAERGV